MIIKLKKTITIIVKAEARLVYAIVIATRVG